MKYSVYSITGWSKYDNVEEAFNAFIKSCSVFGTTCITSELQETIFIRDCKLVYMIDDGKKDITPLKKQYMGYIVKNNNTINKLYNDILNSVNKLCVQVDKFELESVLTDYYLNDGRDVQSLAVVRNQYNIAICVNRSYEMYVNIVDGR